MTGLVQDAIFSRPPDAGVDTGIFIAGKDVSLALDMFDAGEEGDGAAIQGVGVRRSGRLLHHGRGHGRQGREGA